MKKENKILLFALLSYIIPVSLFGNFDFAYPPLGIILLSINSVILFFLIKKKFKNKNLSYYIVCALFAFFEGIFKLSSFSISQNKSNISNYLGISFYSSNIVAYWISLISFCIFYLMYKDTVESSIKKEFENDEIRINRDKKINSIIKKWY